MQDGLRRSRPERFRKLRYCGCQSCPSISQQLLPTILWGTDEKQSDVRGSVPECELVTAGCCAMPVDVDGDHVPFTLRLAAEDWVGELR